MRSLISSRSPVLRQNLKPHTCYQLSLFTVSNVAIAMQNHPVNIHQPFATPRYSDSALLRATPLPRAMF